MSDKYINPSGLAHYDEKIKEVIDGKDKELSFDEYNALSDDDKNNGTTYYVPDATLGSDDVIFSVDDETLSATYDNKTIELVDGNLKADTLYYDEEKSELQLKSGDNILSSVTIHDGLKIVTWADGTYDEIKAMLSAHYAGLIDISDYWSVGDVRTIPISSISATGVGETQSAQNAEVVIIGFEHDDLVTSVNGNSKSAVSLQLKNSLETVGYMYSAYTGTDYSLWDGSPRRTWCNGVFKNALPTELVSLIKTVTKKTWRYANSGYSGYSSYRTQQTTNDDCFLISEFEVLGVQGLSADTYGTVGEDGIQYEYYKTTSNRIKYLGVSGTSANAWWLRSSYVGDGGGSLFRYVGTSGSVGGSFANYAFGVAPGFCI